MLKKRFFDFFLNRPILSATVVFLLTLPITIIGSFIVLEPQFGVRGEDRHGIGAFVFIVVSFVLGGSASSATALTVGLMLWRRLKLKLL